VLELGFNDVNYSFSDSIQVP